ncbi:MAG TPA: ATP-binding protein [Cellvibrio sp.]|nr:ATP-binding protein [Cellvibrio sp.]
MYPNYKGFVDFKITFDEASPITTIIGQNGVGKSNLIEIIVSIFRAIDLGEQTDFSYSLSYECREHEIQVIFNADDATKNLVFIDKAKKSFSYLKNNAKEYLPLNIFTYYSGTNERVESLFVKHQTRFYEGLTKGDDQLIRRFFYCREVHSFFVLLAFLVDDEKASKDLLEKLHIKSLESVLFVLKKPYWYKGRPSEIMLAEGDERFWYSRGIVKDFLSNLWSEAIAPIDNSERKIIDFRGRSENQDRLYLFLPDKVALENLAGKYSDTTALFKNLESTYIADLLEDVQVTVTTTDNKELTFSSLSEGERQLLTVLGLMKFTRDDESLFLLDEPDTHLNPRWKLNYFDQIKKILDHKIAGSKRTAWQSSQVILTTHDPMMLTSLHAKQVRVITEKDRVKEAELPNEDPINLGVEAIIQSELYGIRTSLDIEIQNKIDHRNQLLSTQDLSERELEKLLKLNEELDALGLQYAHPNPYFSNFSKAISRSPLFRRPEFTPEEYDELQSLSDEILAEVLKEEADNDKN